MNNLEKFDLQKALDGAELETRDERKVSEWHYFKEDKGDFPIQAIINGRRIAYTIDGNFGKEGEHPNDLFIKPKVKECWVNVFINKDGALGVGSYHSSKEKAIRCRLNGNTYIKTIRITDEPE